MHSLAAKDPNSFVDLLNNHDLQLLKGQKTGKRPEPSITQDGKPQKKYLIMTKIDRESQQKVHYPLPLMPLDTDKPHTLDPATIKQMIARMARSMTALHQQTDQSQSSYSQSNHGGADSHFVTARSFFSKDNPDHPAVMENSKLRKRM